MRGNARLTFFRHSLGLWRNVSWAYYGQVRGFIEVIVPGGLNRLVLYLKAYTSSISSQVSYWTEKNFRCNDEALRRYF